MSAETDKSKRERALKMVTQAARHYLMRGGGDDYARGQRERAEKEASAAGCTEREIWRCATCELVFSSYGHAHDTAEELAATLAKGDPHLRFRVRLHLRTLQDREEIWEVYGFDPEDHHVERYGGPMGRTNALGRAADAQRE